jgi:hypothetical protein
MLAASDIGGMMAMVPAFATDGAADIRATDKNMKRDNQAGQA